MKVPVELRHSIRAIMGSPSAPPAPGPSSARATDASPADAARNERHHDPARDARGHIQALEALGYHVQLQPGARVILGLAPISGAGADEERALQAGVTPCGVARSSASEAHEPNRVIKQLRLHEVLFDDRAAAVPARESDDLGARPLDSRRELTLKQVGESPLVG